MLNSGRESAGEKTRISSFQQVRYRFASDTGQNSFEFATFRRGLDFNPLEDGCHSHCLLPTSLCYN